MSASLSTHSNTMPVSGAKQSAEREGQHLPFVVRKGKGT